MIYVVGDNVVGDNIVDDNNRTVNVKFRPEKP